MNDGAWIIAAVFGYGALMFWIGGVDQKWIRSIRSVRKRIHPDLLACATDLSDDGDPVTSACAFWINETDKTLGFVRCVNSKEDADHLARMLREHADTLSRWEPIDLKALLE